MNDQRWHRIAQLLRELADEFDGLRQDSAERPHDDRVRVVRRGVCGAPIGDLGECVLDADHRGQPHSPRRRTNAPRWDPGE